MSEGRILLPNEDGVLVPTDEASMALGELSDNEKLLCLAANSGGSGEGMSHYAQASRCGRRARLSAARYKSFAENERALPATKNHFIIGSVMHKLHELARKPQDVVLDYNEQFKNPNVAEGARLYKGWLRHWGLDFWGQTLGVELHLSDDTTFVAPLYKNAAEENHGRIRVTAAIDMVVQMDTAACERAKQRGLELEPGIYLVDWKSADAPSDGVSYREGLQALWYPYLYNKTHPEKPCLGTIFDVVLKRSRRKDRTVLRDDFQAFYVPYGMESVETLRGMVEQGHRNIVEDIPNRSECTSWRGDCCPFKLNGECDARIAEAS